MSVVKLVVGGNRAKWWNFVDVDLGRFRIKEERPFGNGRLVMKTQMLVPVGLIAALIGFGAFLWAAAEPGFVGPRSPQMAMQTGSWIVTSAVGENRQQIVIADPIQQSLAVYHVDLSTGRIALKSVRHVRFDLLMTEFNTDPPSPRELEALMKSP